MDTLGFWLPSLFRVVGNWEHIDLSYSYGKQKESSNMTLAADHTITDGSWKGGTWNYDAEKQILTANGVELCLPVHLP